MKVDLRAVEKYFGFVAMVFTFAMVLMLSGVQSAHATLAELFAAVDVTGVSTNVQTLLISFIGINILFLGYKFVRRSMSRG